MSEFNQAQEMEALKLLKARYCRLLDAKDWAHWRGLFTDDFISDTSESGGKRVSGGDEFVAFVRSTLGDPRRSTVHQVHAPELVLTSPTTATGVWALNDIIRMAPGLTYQGYGHYHETYEKQHGQWRIKTSRLTRLREEIETPFLKIRIPDWLKKALSKKMAPVTESAGEKP